MRNPESKPSADTPASWQGRQLAVSGQPMVRGTYVGGRLSQFEGGHISAQEARDYIVGYDPSLAAFAEAAIAERERRHRRSLRLRAAAVGIADSLPAVANIEPVAEDVISGRVATVADFVDRVGDDVSQAAKVITLPRRQPEGVEPLDAA